ncbi:TPM domain-containing protein [Streptomyces longispororuber]|uniref:TPM domain-containing protein n=1 Tax=Streptomyces longispororuber TaxID=68230 RepID=UPI0033CE053A
MTPSPPSLPPAPPSARAARCARAGWCPRAAAVAALLLGCWYGPPPAYATATAGPAPVRTADGDGGVAGDLVAPVVAAGAAGAFALVSYRRRRRRFAHRTTPGGPGEGQAAPPADLDARAARLLVDTDDAVRASAAELAFTAARFGAGEVRPFAEAVAYARGELAAAFRLRQRLDDARPQDDATRRRALDEIVARCAEANRCLDAEAAAFDGLRSLERAAPGAVEYADTVLRQVTARARTADAVLKEARAAYAPAATAAVLGYAAQAEDRLAFATARLRRAREAAAAGDGDTAAGHLRAAEAAIGQAAVFVDGVHRHADALAEADRRLPDALAEAGTGRAAARESLRDAAAGGPAAGLRDLLARADAVVAQAERARAAGAYDPVDLLRRVTEADAALDHALAAAGGREAAADRADALLGPALLVARGTVATAREQVTTHLGAVGAEARTRLAEAERHLERAEGHGGRVDPRAARFTAPASPVAALVDARRADALARQARTLAERDVRAYGHPDGGEPGDGVGGAVLGGILRGPAGDGSGPGDGGPGGGGPRDGGPGAFGGTRTRGRTGSG